ncbi:unnamed protein product [Danaus chrysippus]|uniref:(African queen) hypothetical protein n=1 Tax=Danaus chrysippus TaxID=151541 RepID=A0A8J2QM70_9NEOP|nr:unnamed protein product [Danaus chrysippus]
MRVIIYVLVVAVCVSAQSNQIRRTKLPYVADAVGNSLPPPSSGPATVGSPVNLLTPDKYEFYTFDESGELVKRLMTLEEIQAIVAAGEETDGLVTFANDNLPTLTFNFSQPSQTKVHNVVANVQNVLKAQMEAHKNKPYIQPTLDTPDVSDSWSLILPSIFGNTGMDIVPDKLSDSFITPETETIDINGFNKEGVNSLSKESNDIPMNPNSETNKIPVVESTTEIPSTTKKPLETTTLPTTTTTTQKPISTTAQEILTTTQKPSSTTARPTTTRKINLEAKPMYKPKENSTDSTKNSNVTEQSKITSTKQPITATSSEGTPTKQVPIVLSLSDNFNKTPTKKSNITKTSTNTVADIKQSHEEGNYIPVSTVSYVTESSTKIIIMSNKYPMSSENSLEVQKTTILTSTNKPIVDKDKEFEKQNATTMTTQSISPSTSISPTEFASTSKHESPSNFEQKNPSPFDTQNYNSDSTIPLFDVAQSLSQIASDLSGNFSPVPTSTNLLETTKINNIDIESKENLEIDIPTEPSVEFDVKENKTEEVDKFVKISTFEPAANGVNAKDEVPNSSQNSNNSSELKPPVTSSPPLNNMDTLLSESMDNLLSQVANEDPDSTTVVSENNNENNDITTTSLDLTTVNTFNLETTTENYQTEITTNSPITSNDIITEKNNDNEEINRKETPSEPLLLLNLNNTSKTKTNIVLASESVTTDAMSIPKDNVQVTTRAPMNHLQQESLMVTNDNQQTTSTIKITSSVNDINTTNVPHTTQETNKSSNINKQQKISEELPKIEDFKKKIQKVNIDDKEFSNERNSSWKLVPTVVKLSELAKDKHNVEGFYTPDNDKDIVLEFPKENQGLEVTTKDLPDDIMEFTELCNELAFKYWNIMTEKIDKKRSMVFSPYSITSMAAMMFMGAKGSTSGEMNEVLKLDDMVTFNPHFTLKNISDSIDTAPSSGVAVSAFIRELYSERNKGKFLTFYKERAQHFYNGHVEEVNFKLISDIIRRRTNLLVKRYSWGKISEYMKSNSIVMNPPLAAFAANIFYTDCNGSSVEGRDGEMYFVVSPSVRQRRLVPVPAVVYREDFLAGYDPVLDATAAALGNTKSIISTLFLMPGQQGNIVHSDDLENLEKRLLKSDPITPAWNRLLRTLLPRFGLELQIPRFSHKSVFNVSSTLQRMGLKDLFSEEHADLGGLNGPSKDLYLTDMIQQTSFATCGEGIIAEQHHIEEYPDTIEVRSKRRTSRWNGWGEPRDYQRAFHDPHDAGEAMYLPLHLRPRQARLPTRSSQPARLKFDRPFLYFVRHNPSGMILYVGRYNPRLLP